MRVMGEHGDRNQYKESNLEYQIFEEQLKTVIKIFW